MKSRSYIGFGLAAIIALIAVTAFMGDQISTTNAAGGGPDGEMKLTVTSGGTCEGTKCTVAEGAAFTLAVEIVGIPDTGYLLAQSFVVYGPDLVYNPTERRSAEILWPDCEGATAVGVFWGADGATDASIFDAAIAINHGCLTGLFPADQFDSTFVGNYVEMSFNCSSAASSTEILLLPEGDDLAGTSGAQFKDTSQTAFVPKTTNVTVNCGVGGDTPVPTTPPVATTPPAATDTPTPTNTPVPTEPPDQICGDINDDGVVDSRDALWVLWFTADLVSELEKDGDVNGDGEVTSVDASLILQAEAGQLESPCV